MKVLLLLSSGLAAPASDALDGRTPVEAADTPGLDRIAREGRLGLVRWIPKGCVPSVSNALIALLGYDPRRESVGPGGLLARGLDVPLGADDLALRLDLVATHREQIVEPAAGGVTEAEGRRLVQALDAAASSGPFRFHVGERHRHLLVARGGRSLRITTTPPWVGLGRSVETVLPGGPDGPLLADVMTRARVVLAAHDVNRVRADLGEPPADLVVPWGPGVHVVLEPWWMANEGALAVVPSSAHVLGLGRAVEATVPDATLADPTEAGRVALEMLAEHDVVLLDLVGPSPWSGPREAAARLAELDRLVIGPLLAELSSRGDTRLAVVTHRDGRASRAGAGELAGPAAGGGGRVVRRGADRGAEDRSDDGPVEPVPFALWGPDVSPVRARSFSVAEAERGDLRVEAGATMLAFLRRPAARLETTG